MTDYLVDLCPQCKERTEYHPNQCYIYKCDSCGYNGHQQDLIKAVDTKRAERKISDLEWEIARIREFQKELPEAPKE